MSDAIYWPTADVLILASQVASAGNLPSPAELRQRVTDILDRMVSAARAAGIQEADIAEARYALVAFIDEQILKSSWHGRGEWMNQPLQLVFYREFTAGENFFARMRALLNQGGREAALEIYFLCLALGFRGAYGVGGDPAALESFTSAAQQQVLRRLPSSTKISPNAQPRDRARADKSGTGALVGILAACAIVVIGVIASFQWSLRSTVNEALQAMPAPAAPPAR